MKILRTLICLSLLTLGCSPDGEVEKNPYLPDLNVAFQLDLNLPQYHQLNYPGNSFVTYTYGINGVVIYNLNNDQYLAFELTDPNHIPSTCSRLEVTDTKAVCGCQDSNEYTIITGQALSEAGPYSLKSYRVVRTGSILEVSN